MYRLLLFVMLPLTDMALLVFASQQIGFLVTLGIVIGTGVLGATLVKRQGLAVWISARQRLAEGAMPTREIVHGAMLLVAGAFLLTPGFITDLTGSILLIPAVREWLRRRFGGRVARGFIGRTTRVDVWR